MKNLITCLVVSVLSGAAFADTWTVDDDGKADFNNIQAAVDAASDGDEIIVAPGTYTSTAGDVVDMQGKQIWLHSSAGAGVTIIDGEGAHRGIYCHNGETNTIIEGFTITNCFGSPGGGMYNWYSSPRLINCIFTGNYAYYGGGMYNDYSNPTLTNCTFENNGTYASFSGGGMYNLYSSPTLTDCTFTGNSTYLSGTGSGGGMLNASSNPTLTRCTFTYNKTYSFGGGMANYNSNTTLTDCTFRINYSYYYGGGGMYNSGISNITMTNCVLTNNYVQNLGGGGMRNDNGCSPTLTDTQVCDNTHLLYGPNNIMGDWTDNGGNTVDEQCSSVDEDGDGVSDYQDNCYLYNPDQADCNGNYVGDVCDIANGTSEDTDGNGMPDECLDSDGDGVSDDIDNCYLYNPDQLDCNGNDIGDVCDIADGTSNDIDGNGIPDECETDCNNNGIPDYWDIKQGNSQDCNENSVPDECDIGDGTSNDIDGNGIPDECETDCNNNGIPDYWDIKQGNSQDCNENSVPDECDIADGTSNDIDGNGIPDECNILIIQYPDGRPMLVNPNGGTLVAIDVDAGSSEPSSSGGYLHWSTGFDWYQVTLEPALDSDYEAIFPPFECSATIDWYVSFESVDGDLVNSPADAPLDSWFSNAYSDVEVFFEDNFEVDQGWTVDASAGAGNWIRVIPSEGGDRCDPSQEVTEGMCFVTGNSGDEDVDDGTTILYSPIIDATDGLNLSYYRWYNNGLNCNGGDPNNDYFYVDISSDGGSTWMNLETVGPIDESNGGWYFVEHDLYYVNGFETSADFMVRFVCGDLNAASVIEAGVDTIMFERGFCTESTCPADVTDDGIVNVTDLLTIIDQWGLTNSPADVNQDGIVDVSDLLIVVGNWGPCE